MGCIDGDNEIQYNGLVKLFINRKIRVYVLSKSNAS
jgi:hypothetical protein